LRVLGNLLGLPGFDQDDVGAVRAEVAGGATDLAGRCANRAEAAPALQNITVLEGMLERVTDVPLHFADNIARRSPPLLATIDGRAPRARMNGKALARLGLAAGDTVRVVQGQAEALLPCACDEAVADGCVRIAAAHPSTAGLGAMFGAVVVQKAQGSAAASGTTPAASMAGQA